MQETTRWKDHQILEVTDSVEPADVLVTDSVLNQYAAYHSRCRRSATAIRVCRQLCVARALGHVR